MSYRVTIIIPNWNGRQHLELCLPAVFSMAFQDFEVIVVDNGSADGSVDLVRTAFPQVRLIQNEENHGFAQANNQAIRASAARYIATLNNDTQVEPGWLGALVEIMESDSGIGMCASNMLCYDRPQVIDSAGIEVDWAGIGWDRRRGERDGDQDQDVVEIFGPCAGAALYRRKMLDQVGLFDEDYFAYYEDVDLAWRARLAGWRCLYVPAARVYHAHSATLKGNRNRKQYYLGRNKIWTILKNAFLFHLPGVLAYELAIVAYHALAGNTGALHGRIAALRDLDTVWSKRRQIQQNRAVSVLALLKMMVPPKNPIELARRGP